MSKHRNQPNTDIFTDASSDHLLSVNVKTLLNFEGNLLQNVHYQHAFQLALISGEIKVEPCLMFFFVLTHGRLCFPRCNFIIVES